MILDKDPGSKSVFLGRRGNLFGRVQLRMYRRLVKFHAKIVPFRFFGLELENLHVMITFA